MSFNSKNYWEERYKKGGNSGLGSYGKLASFKSDVVNRILTQYKIDRVADFGCGDGNQIGTMKFKSYVGFDVSKTAALKCREIYKADKSKTFHLCTPENVAKFAVNCDLTMSLDVLFHLVEDEVYMEYLNQLVNTSNKYILIYSCNFEDKDNTFGVHVKPRIFTNDIEKMGLKLVEYIKNPHESLNDKQGSFSNFYLYEK